MTRLAALDSRRAASKAPLAPAEPLHARVRRAVAAAAGLTALEERSGERWLRAAADFVYDGVGGRCAIVAFIASASRENGGWRVHRAAVAGLAPRDVARSVLNQALAGWPEDDLNSPERDLAAGESQRVILRSDLAGEAPWKRSRWHRWRRRVGLHGFVRAARSFDDEKGRRTLVLEAEGTSPDWEGDRLMQVSFDALAEAVRDAYVRRFVEPGERRRELLARLSETRAVIAPLLADGYTESEIGKMLGRSAHTVHEHAEQIYRIWGVRSRFALRDLWNGADSLPGYYPPVR